MATSARPNFFLLLGLKPDAVWDQAVFEKALREKRIEWSRQSAGVAKKALLAKQNLALIPRIQEIMTDPVLREQEAEAARAELIKKQAAEYARFERQLAFLNAKEVVEQEEVAKFVEAYKHLLPAEEIMKRIEVKIGSHDAAKISTGQTLDAAIFKSVNDRLQFIHMSTLYEFLQQARTTSTPALLRAAEGLYPQLVLQPPTAENVAKIELAGLACDIFRSEEMRTRYDESLRGEALNSLFTELDDVMSRATVKEISHKQVLLFLDQARKAGWKDKEALERLGEHARLRKWNIVTPIISPKEEKILCPNCDHLNDTKQRYCTMCNQALFVDCPQCGTSSPCDSRACGNCGFAVGNRYLVDSLLKELPGHLEVGDVRGAEAIINELEQMWPSHIQDVRTQQIETYRNLLRSILDAEQQVLKDIRERMGHLGFSEVSNGGRYWVYINWSPPVHGTVVIVKSMEPLHQEGNVLPETELEQLGQLLEDRGNFTTDDCHPSTIVYYTPVIILLKKAYIGVSQPYIYRENVGKLSYQQLGSTIRLRWSWPQGCEEVLIAYSAGRWPQPDSPAATVCTVKRLEYDQLGYYDIRNASNLDYYIIVTSVFQWEGERLLAQGERLLVRGASKTIITYEIRRPMMSPRKRTLHLTVDPVKPLPVLLVVSRQDRLPFQRTDGDLFCRRKVTVKAKNIMIELPDTPLPPGTFGKLFLEDDALYREFIIHHPCQDRMKLS